MIPVPGLFSSSWTVTPGRQRKPALSDLAESFHHKRNLDHAHGVHLAVGIDDNFFAGLQALDVDTPLCVHRARDALDVVLETRLCGQHEKAQASRDDATKQSIHTHVVAQALSAGFSRAREGGGSRTDKPCARLETYARRSAAGSLSDTPAPTGAAEIRTGVAVVAIVDGVGINIFRFCRAVHPVGSK
jgi:hypothetical protein